MPDLSNSVALITGASQGIGAAVARSLHDAGAELILVGRDSKRLKGTSPARTQILEADLSDVDGLGAAVNGLLASRQKLDILVNCGGMYARGSWPESGPEQLIDMLQTNVVGAYTLTRGLLPLLVRARGYVVFVNSSIVNANGAGTGQFKATQHALKGLADSLRAEVNRSGVRVTSIFPGRTATPRQAHIHELEGNSYSPDTLLQPEDVAETILSCLLLPPTAEVTDLHMRPAIAPNKP